MRRFAIVLLIIASASLTDAYGNNRDLETRLTAAFAAGQLSGLHSVLVLRKGEIFAEVHFSGKDERWGSDLGDRTFGPATLHDLRSISKSIVGLLYGIALAEGKVPGVDEGLLKQFPQYSDLAGDPKRQNMLIRHALTMKMGSEWNEDLPYTDPRNSEIAMEHAKDRYRFVLERPMVEEPGTSWDYNGGATAIVAKLIADGVGMPMDNYAEQTLFTPLGIKEFEWVRGANGEPAAASGLRLNIHGLARLGQLILQNGRFEGKQIIPADWLKSSFAPQADLKGGLRYGYFWWLAPASLGEEPAWVAGFGNGGQRLVIRPESDVVIAIFAGNYNQPGNSKLPARIIEEFVNPALKAELEAKR
jgi:CubicO group peptidase (beta-lactamase class C family)